MAYYQNGQPYRSPAPQQNSPSQYQRAHTPRSPSFDAGDDSTLNGRGSEAYGYTGLTTAGRSSSSAARHHDELFMGEVSPPLDMPQSPSQQSYNPRNFPPPVPIPNPQAYGGVNRTQYTPISSPHQPYNPAAYADNQSYAPSAQSGGSRTGSQYGHRPVQSPVYPYTNAPTLPPRPSYSSPAPLPMPPIGGGASFSPDGYDPIARRPSISERYAQWPIASDTYSDVRSPSEGQLYRYDSQDSQLSPGYQNQLPPTPGPPPPPHSPQRQNTLGRHPQSRPLPGPPPEAITEEEYFTRPNGMNGRYGSMPETVTQDELFQQLEHEVMNTGNSNYRGNGPRIEYGGSYDYSDESDAEAAAGLAALQMAEDAERADEARRASGGTGLFSSYSTIRPQPSPQEQETEPLEDPGSDGDFVGVDIGAYGGSYEPQFSYGGDPAELASGHSNLQRSESHSQTLSSSGSMRKSEGASEMEPFDPIHPFPPFSSARVDTFGTGGFAEPSSHRRRLSYDEGDESSLMDGQTHSAGEPPDMFYHPGMSAHSRPLPPPPVNTTQFSQSQPPYSYQPARGPFPSTPDTMVTPSGVTVPRSTSLVSHSSTPQMIPPIRSKTDAEERRLRQQQLRSSAYLDKENTVTPTSASTMPLDLPALPAGKRFNPSKLTQNDFKRCTEPWALGSVIGWLRAMAGDETDLREHHIYDALLMLFTVKVPTMHTIDAETLSTKVVQDMYKAGTLERVEEWLKFTDKTTSGVLFQLTQAGCYAPRLHEQDSEYRCYAPHCQRTVRKVNLKSQPSQRGSNWISWHKLSAEDLEKIDLKEQGRQHVLHEIIETEETYLAHMAVVRVLYRDALASQQPPVIPPKKMKGFMTAVFGKVEAVRQANEEHLLPQLKYRQKEQAPVIAGFSDIFREWIRRARSAYIDYAADFPYATFLVRQEAEKNILFRSFLEQQQKNKMSERLPWDSHLKAPITRIQRIILLLDTLLKRSKVESEEKKNLQSAIAEIRAVVMECDTQVADKGRKVDLTDLQSKLILRPGMQRVELNLSHLGRKLVYKGDLQRMGGTRYTWLETHALLFDHYLVLAKTVLHRDVESNAKQERYDVSRLPIPMDLLVLESTNDDPVVKSSVKGVATVNTTRASAGTPESRLRAGSTASPSPNPLEQQNTNTSSASGSSNRGVASTTVLSGPQDEKIMYPFRIKHLGKEPYTLFAPTAKNRAEWCKKILEAKTEHAEALYTQNAEPFRIRVMADSAFAYEGPTAGCQGVTIKGTPLDRAIDEVEKMYAHTGRPGPICRAKVNCATAFMQPFGKPMVAVGTDFGVYVSEMDNPRGWSRTIQTAKVTQIAVLEEFNIFLLISDKSLIAYHLDSVCPVGSVASGNDSTRRAPQKLSGSRDVGFFATGRMKDRTLVLYKKREGLSSTFKVLEPVYQKSSEKKSRLFRGGKVDFFREYDEFYVPTESFGINLFQSSLAVSSSKGFEVLTLDKKQPWSVPDLKAPAVATIASRLSGLDPLGMFRLSDQEFLLCYEECAVYCNKHGDISRSVVMEFVGKARSAALYGPYVLLFDPDFVEVRNAQNGRLRQVIPGRDVKCLDDGLGLGGSAVVPGVGHATVPGGGPMGMGATGVGGRTVKLAMQHPRTEKCQIVVELLLNPGVFD
ncbi:hypothetical protein K490DRAFT_46361 [Saccharata proteae CBS 121410]|uniref:CNH-domain-containing protein n=1 Tax=Saccharata proteae CBS 121410 TaxID=1314787 RepID=A0A9P4LWW4_9PEZI|nr:hypothetical protein K490DRAFT_46361 [Saccharata proteae CBS 121410]